MPSDSQPAQHSSGAGLRRNALDLIDHEHRMQAHLCDTLERIADSLPDEVDSKLCQQAVQSLRHDLPLHHRDEEAGLFPLLQKYSDPDGFIQGAIKRLEQEHGEDEGFSTELIEQLENLGRTGRPQNANMLGYMLRGFFESYRRHIHWENTTIMPYARAHLTGEDLRLLQDIMLRNRATQPGYQS
jgi:hemerythrin-like domain-containing protein